MVNPGTPNFPSLPSCGGVRGGLWGRAALGAPALGIRPAGDTYFSYRTLKLIVSAFNACREQYTFVTV